MVLILRTDKQQQHKNYQSILDKIRRLLYERDKNFLCINFFKEKVVVQKAETISETPSDKITDNKTDEFDYERFRLITSDQDKM